MGSVLTLIEPTTLILIAAAYLLGSVVKGVTGFGALLVAVPIMSMVVEPATAIAVTSGSVIVSNVWQLIESRQAMWVLRRFWSLLLALLPATLVGSQFLAKVDGRVSGAVIGVMVILYCLSQISRFHPTVRERHTKALNPVIGGAAGLVGGATILTGSVLIMYLVALRLRKDQFVGAIALMYLVNAIPIYLTLSYFGRYSANELAVSVGLVAPALTGIVIGRIVRQRVSQKLFQRLVIGLLLMIGLNLLLKAV